MKLLDRVAKRALEGSEKVKRVIDAFDVLVGEVNKLGVAVLSLAQTIQIHQQAIQDLYVINGAVMRAVQDKSVDLNLPTGSEKASPEKPN